MNESLQTEVERLRWLVLQSMNVLAEEVLGQIQATRAMAEQTQGLLGELASGPDDSPAAEVRHLRLLSTRIEQAMQDLPESAWDDFASTCIQLARTLVRVQSTD